MNNHIRGVLLITFLALGLPIAAQANCYNSQELYGLWRADDSSFRIEFSSDEDGAIVGRLVGVEQRLLDVGYSEGYQVVYIPPAGYQYGENISYFFGNYAQRNAKAFDPGFDFPGTQ